ncbi:MAG: alpha-amylase family glycosyl hydrolase [Candidatus Cyclobacteriaceae bacterium M3_2C_046]
MKENKIFKYILTYSILFLWLLLLSFCGNKDESKDNMGLDQFTLNPENQEQKIIIYQVFTRLFGNTNSNNRNNGSRDENGVGKFNDFTDTALQAIKNSGYTHIWYTGVIEHALMTDYSDWGIQKDNPEVVKGRAGSPYAIKDYYDVNPDLAEDIPGRMKEFEALVDRTHQNGLKMIIDFVPNHVARQYHSDAKPAGVTDLGEKDKTSVAFSRDNNFYYLPGQSFQVPEGYDPMNTGNPVNPQNQTYRESPAKATGNDLFSAEPSIYDWYETVKLNYGIDYQNDRTAHFDPIPDTWLKMKEILTFWAEKGLDGFRCDMAQMVPVEFWSWVIPQIRAINPDILFIAEIYDPSMYEQYVYEGKFDYLYDKVQLYDTLKYVIQGTSSPDHITRVWQDLGDMNGYMLRFLENHDEQRIASPDFAGDPWKAFPAMVVSTTLYTGPVMVYFGQEVGEPGAGNEGFGGDDGRTTIFDYWGVPEHQKWMNQGAFDGGLLAPTQKSLYKEYQQLLKFAGSSPAIAQGAFLDLDAYHRTDQQDMDQTYSFLRYSDQEKILVITNFSDQPVQKTIMLPREVLTQVGLNEHIAIQSVLNKYKEVSYQSSGREIKLNLDLPAWGYYILKLQQQ